MKTLLLYLLKKRSTNILFDFLYMKLSKKYYWYEVKFVYRESNNGSIVFDFKDAVGLQHQSTILLSRKIKKIIKPLHLRKDIKPYLCNGVFSCEIICYLGHFNKPVK